LGGAAHSFARRCFLPASLLELATDRGHFLGLALQSLLARRNLIS
jgi:hypothetical protein